MKKLIILLITLILLTSCAKPKEKNLYEKYIEELSDVTTSTPTDLDISVSVEPLSDNTLSYNALITRNNIIMKDVKAILIHDKPSANAFPSIGIYDPPITLDETSASKGIKLTGYIDPYDTITFKLLLTYKNEEDKTEKVYYIYNYRQVT